MSRRVRIPEMRAEGSLRRPTGHDHRQGRLDVFGIGLSLLVDGLGTDEC
jgi:hypothetical protein